MPRKRNYQQILDAARDEMAVENKASDAKRRKLTKQRLEAATEEMAINSKSSKAYKARKKKAKRPTLGM